MQLSPKDLRAIVDKLEQTLSELDCLDAKIAAIHIDSAIVELCRIAEIERFDREAE